MKASATKGGKLIALTFDDGPGEYTSGLLDGLAERGIKVTFFMLGERAAIYQKTVKRAYSEGHQIAQHTYNHVQLSKKSDAQIFSQLKDTDAVLNQDIGVDLKYLLRPPYGDYNSHVLSVIGRAAINWSIDPQDWKDRNSDTVYNRIVNNAFDGAIILCHDIHKTTIPGALRAIDTLKSQGYEFVTVNELFRRRGTALTDGKLYVSCKPNGTDLGPVSEPTATCKAVYGGQRVTLSADAGASIYYTTDGSDPAINGKLYTEPFIAAQGQELKYIASFNLNGSRSALVSNKIEGKALTEPTIKAENGMFVFSNPNENTDVFYTTDGSTPTEKSIKYTKPFACYEGQLSYCVMGKGVGTTVKSYYTSKSGNLFLDVKPGDWYFSEIDYAVTEGLLNGTAPNQYEPNDSLTRAMFVTMLNRLLGEKVTGGKEKNSFKDVAKDAWYGKAVIWAAENGIVNGYEDGTFRPDVKISREEMCVILDRLLTALGKNVEKETLTFSDAARISAWARDSVARLVKTDIIRGQENHRFAPSSTATRAESATVLHRLSNLLQK